MKEEEEEEEEEEEARVEGMEMEMVCFENRIASTRLLIVRGNGPPSLQHQCKAVGKRQSTMQAGANSGTNGAPSPQRWQQGRYVGWNARVGAGSTRHLTLREDTASDSDRSRLLGLDKRSARWAK